MIQEAKRSNELLITAQVELAIINSKGKIQKPPHDLLNKI